MQELKPFLKLSAFKKALDNGGRFYNFFDAANDEVISRGELAKAAGVFTAGMQAFLFLEMSKQDLDQNDQESALAMLDAKVRKSFAKKKPSHVNPSLVDRDRKAGESIIVTGFGKEIDSHSQFNGFIVVPIMVGKVMVPMMIPIHSMYRVIEVFDNDEMRAPSAIVCTPMKKKLELSGRVQFGGVLKKFVGNSKKPATHPLFLETLFWMKR